MEQLGLELQAIGAIGHPPAVALDVLTRRNGGSRPNHSNQVALPAYFDPQDAKTGVLAMKRHTLDRTRQVLCGIGTG